MHKHNSKISVVLFPICDKQINKLQKIWVEVGLRPLIPKTMISNVAKLAFLIKSNLSGLPYSVYLSPLAE